MAIFLRRINPVIDAEKLAAAVFQPEGLVIKHNHFPYRGKYTRTIFEIITSSQATGVTEYSISELMELLSLEHTRYSYGQLKLRVLEPSLQEIYDHDDAIFVEFGPAFSGRRVNDIWFKVTMGEKARALRKKRD
ncbi:replication initiation protein [Sporomusa aerivorans]|uniref:replication initiation protein n=1 Tax=Sporomusa aerivorans TaxID=204936 RepID=UPI003529D9FF